MQCGVLTAEVSIRYAATMFRLSVFVCTRMMYLLKCCNSCMRMKQMISNYGNYIYFVVYKMMQLKNSTASVKCKLEKDICGCSKKWVTVTT